MLRLLIRVVMLVKRLVSRKRIIGSKNPVFVRQEVYFPYEPSSHPW